MSERNVELLKPIYAAWAAGNFAYRPEIYAEDMEWGWSGEFPGMEAVSPDPHERSARLHDWLSGWNNWRCEVEKFVTDGDRVVALCRYRGSGRNSGIEVDNEGAHAWWFRDGEVVRLEVFASHDRALAAAGITD